MIKKPNIFVLSVIVVVSCIEINIHVTFIDNVSQPTIVM